MAQTAALHVSPGADLTSALTPFQILFTRNVLSPEKTPLCAAPVASLCLNKGGSWVLVTSERALSENKCEDDELKDGGRSSK